MHDAVSKSFPRRGRLAALVVTGGAILVSSCASATGASPESTASESMWRSLATPRPEPLPGAARVSIGAVQLLGELTWDPAIEVSQELAVAELVAAGLLRRRDVQVVERRRFGAAVAAERSGQRRPPGAPPAGISPGADFIATAVWVQLTPGQSSVELRLAARSGAMEGSPPLFLGSEDHPVPIARAIVTALLEALADLGRLPAWEDPLTGADGTTTSSRVADATLQSFLSGLAAEESWDWEGARRGYQAAMGDQAFFEATAALARAARLRLGGTLGEN